MSHYGSGERQNDEMKAASCRDGVRALVRLLDYIHEADLDQRTAMEARIGRLAVELLRLEDRLAGLARA